jgi:hypothetical protein
MAAEPEFWLQPTGVGARLVSSIVIEAKDTMSLSRCSRRAPCPQRRLPRAD